VKAVKPPDVLAFPAPATVPASGAMRRSTLGEVLLSVALEAPITDGPRQTATYLADELSRLFPDAAVGLRVEGAPGNGLSREPAWIERRVPLTFPDSVSTDPHAVFSGVPSERIFEIDALGSTLHFADMEVRAISSDEPGSIDASPHLLAARTVSRCMRLSRHRSLQAVAERDRLEARLVQAEKLASLGQIAANIAHELNNPLTAIIADSSMLRRSMLARQESGEDVTDDLVRHDRLTAAVERVLRFSRDLVAYARPSDEVPTRVDLTQVLERALGFCDHELTRLSIRLETQLTEPLAVHGIPSQLAQVFVNLITNAAHAAAEGGHRVTIRTRKEERWTVTLVSDDGVGIKNEDLDRIFEPFFTTKPAGHGTGLGLAIVRDIVDRHGGVLSVETRPGNGASFLVRLPSA
jgi:signal transduction histidine kinase